MKRIEVTQRTDDGLATVCIDADLIDYTKPGIADTSIYFLNGKSIVVRENMRALRELIRKA